MTMTMTKTMPKAKTITMTMTMSMTSTVTVTVTVTMQVQEKVTMTVIDNDNGLLGDLAHDGNGRRKCKLRVREQERERYGLLETCNPYLRSEYSCVPNVGFSTKKQLKNSRKAAKRVGGLAWEDFFQVLNPSV